MAWKNRYIKKDRATKRIETAIKSQRVYILYKTKKMRKSTYINEKESHIDPTFYKHVKRTARHAEIEIEAGLKLINKIDNKVVSIFGSHLIKKNNKYYIECEKTAYELGKRGYAIITGGGPGIMEAANMGAKRAHTVSVGIREKLLSKEQNVDAEIYTYKAAFNFLFVRRFLLAVKSDALIFYPGGYGTLNEFFEYITLVVTGINSKIPIIFVDKKYWSGLYDWLKNSALKEGTISKVDLDLISFANDTKDILKIISQYK